MKAKPVSIGACGALVGPNFKVTVNRLEAGKKEEIITQDDFSDTSAEAMATIMEGLARGVVIPKQREANSRTGINSKPAIITGWGPGDFFTNLDKVARLFPRDSRVIKKFGLERDKGFVQQGVLNGFQKEAMEFDDYISGTRVVGSDPFGNKGKEVQQDFEAQEALVTLINAYQDVDKNLSAEAYSLLQKFMYSKGLQVVESLRHYSILHNNMAAFNRMTEYDTNDPTKGNRFSQIDFRHYGEAGMRIMEIPGMRKALADGIRDACGFPGNHVLCPKVSSDDNDRPLTNVAGSILNHIFVNEGYMTIDDLHSPYA